MPQRLIVGLGNPGQEFMGTRHNAGFLLVDRLIERLGAAERPGGPDCLVWIANVNGKDTALMKPLTFMNLSGNAVAAFLRAHSLAPGDTLVAFDDVALPIGSIRVRPAGSAGGQKGMKHIIDALGTDQIPRLRIGVDSELRQERPLAEFVLEPFAEAELPLMRGALETAEDAAAAWLETPIAEVMAAYNAKKPLNPEPQKENLKLEENIDG